MTEAKPYEIVVLGDVGCPKEAARSLLHSVLNHVADVQIRMLEAISKKYGHSVEELVECVREDPSVLQPGIKEFVEVKYQLQTKSGKKVLIKKS
jgi:hypothetical protein